MDQAVDVPPLSDQDAIQLLERFVVESDELAALETLIGRFNIFDALGIVDQEIRHSNFLAWLLDPSESHGLGQLFLRAVLMDVLRHAPPRLRPMSPVDLDGVDLGGVEVRREWQHIDLLIIADDPKIVIAIENKVHSSEHSGQLSRYKDIVSEKFPHHKQACVYLTVAGDQPSDKDWFHYGYKDLHVAIDRCRNLNKETIGEEVETFLDHYLRIIGSRFMTSARVDDLCERIYRNHRQALDLIFAKKGDPASRLLDCFVQALQDDGSQWAVGSAGKSARFVPEEWLGFVPAVAEYSEFESKGLLRGAVWANPDSFEVHFAITPSADEDLRTALIDHIRRHGKPVGLSVGAKAGAKWARVRKKLITRSPSGLVDDEKTRERVQHMAHETRDAMLGATGFLREFFESYSRTA